MASDYDFIRKQNMERYGTDIKRVGDMLLANRYDDRTHFIFELLQNAEDALALSKDGVERELPRLEAERLAHCLILKLQAEALHIRGLIADLGDSHQIG